MRASSAVQRAGVPSEEEWRGAGSGAGRPGQRPDRRRGVPGVRVRGVDRQQLRPVQHHGAQHLIVQWDGWDRQIVAALSHLWGRSGPTPPRLSPRLMLE